MIDKSVSTPSRLLRNAIVPFTAQIPKRILLRKIIEYPNISLVGVAELEGYMIVI